LGQPIARLTVKLDGAKSQKSVNTHSCDLANPCSNANLRKKAV
jgi:hypothetical protein